MFEHGFGPVKRKNTAELEPSHKSRMKVIADVVS